MLLKHGTFQSLLIGFEKSSVFLSHAQNEQKPSVNFINMETKNKGKPVLNFEIEYRILKLKAWFDKNLSAFAAEYKR